MSSEPPRPEADQPPLYPGWPYPIPMLIELPTDPAANQAIIGIVMGTSTCVVLILLFFFSSLLSSILFIPGFLLAIPTFGLLLVVPLGVVGLIFSSLGRGSWTPGRKELAALGMALSIIALVVFGLGAALSIVVFHALTRP